MNAAYPWSHEIELLLACARREMRDADWRRAERALSAGVEWPRAIAYAHAHGLLPLFARHAAALGAPVDARARLQARAQGIAQRGLQLTAELLAILDACASAGIVAVPLKGPVLAQQVHGSIGLRHYRDIDILFRTADLPRVSTLLTGRGYRVEAIPEATRFTQHNAHDLAAFSPAGSFHVELHYALLTPRGRVRQDLARLEDVLEPYPFMGRSVRVLPHDVAVEYLCEHGAAHAWSRLEWLATVHAIDGRGPGPIAPRVRAARALADLLLNGTVSRGAHPRDARANRIVVDRLSRHPGRNVTMPGESYRYNQLTEPRIRARLHHGAMTFVFPAPYDFDDLPAWLSRSALRFLARPLALVRRQLRGGRLAPRRRTSLTVEGLGTAESPGQVSDGR